MYAMSCEQSRYLPYLVTQVHWDSSSHRIYQVVYLEHKMTRDSFLGNSIFGLKTVMQDNIKFLNFHVFQVDCGYGQLWVWLIVGMVNCGYG